MARSWRGFGSERHAALKLAVAGLSVAGFVGAWAGISVANDTQAKAAPESAVTPSPTATPPPPTVAPRTTGRTSALPTPTPVQSARSTPNTQPAPQVTPRARRSRAS